MPNMTKRRSLRWLAATAAITAAGLVGAASPATAQYPGTNGPVISAYEDGGFNGLRCLGVPMEDPRWTEFYLTDGEGALAPTRTREAGVFYDGGDGVAGRLAVADRTTAGTCYTPRFIGTVDAGSGISFSPDGQSLAVQRGGDVYVINSANGAVRRNLTPNLATTREGNPTWHPNGSVIAYEASDGIRTRPYTGGASKLLVKGKVRAPDYSPDGTKIGYIDATGHLAYANASTGALIKTTPIVPQYADFYWSPDGKQFAFTGNELTCVTATLTGLITSRDAHEGPCVVYGWAKK